MKTIKCKVLAGGKGTGNVVRATKIEGGINPPNSNMDIPFHPLQNHIAGKLTEREKGKNKRVSQSESFQYIMHTNLELMYQEYMQIKAPDMNFIEWCESYNGKTYLAELVLADIEKIGGINLTLNFRS